VEFGGIIVKKTSKKSLFLSNFNRIMQKMRKHTKNVGICKKNAIMQARMRYHFSKVSKDSISIDISIDIAIRTTGCPCNIARPLI